MKQLTKDQLKLISNAFGIPIDHLRAIIRVECSGGGFNNDDTLKIQFEPSWFHKYLETYKIPHTYSFTLKERGIKEYTISANGKTLTNGIENQKGEYEDYNIALSIHKESAMLATSYGMGQTMGFNFKACGFAKVEHMVNSYQENESNQVIGMCNFIQNNMKLYKAVKEADWRTVSYIYNGPLCEQEPFNYVRKLKEEHALIIKQNG